MATKSYLTTVATETQGYLINDSECLADFFFTVGVLHFSSHHSQKFWEVNGAITSN